MYLIINIYFRKNLLGGWGRGSGVARQKCYVARLTEVHPPPSDQNRLRSPLLSGHRVTTTGTFLPSPFSLPSLLGRRLGGGTVSVALPPPLCRRRRRRPSPPPDPTLPLLFGGGSSRFQVAAPSATCRGGGVAGGTCPVLLCCGAASSSALALTCILPPPGEEAREAASARSIPSAGVSSAVLLSLVSTREALGVSSATRDPLRWVFSFFPSKEP